MKFSATSVASLLLLLGNPAVGDWRCDCTSVVDSCQAEVQVKGNWIEVTSNTQSCARVDYFVDGLPFVALVVDGLDRQDWQSQTTNPQVMVQSCQVCRERPADARQPAQPADDTAALAARSDTETGLVPLIKVAPSYPERARLNGLEGYVVVEFNVNADGRVEQSRVVSARPQRVFNQAALAAVRRWRFAPRDPGSAAETLKEQIDFKLSAAQRRGGGARTASTRARPVNRPRNECLRESAAYDFGEMVEVGLINACATPIVVYACGVGTGASAGRWVCQTPERNATVLIQRGADLLSTAVIGTAGSGVAYSQDQFLIRAPNSQYWWLACEPSDEDCRAAGREWTSDIQMAPATVDPQRAARITVARSR